VQVGQVGLADVSDPAGERVGVVGVRHEEWGEVPGARRALGYFRGRRQ
jgi:hypothetical protein